MAAENIERLREAFEALERGDDEAALTQIAPDFELRDHVILEDTTQVRGPDAMAENIARLRGAFDRVSYEILEIFSSWEEGEASHFVELTPEGEVIRAE